MYCCALGLPSFLTRRAKAILEAGRYAWLQSPEGLPSARFFEISILTGDYGQPHIECYGKIKLYSWRGREIWGIPPQPQLNTQVNKRLRKLWQRLQLLQARHNRLRKLWQRLQFPKARYVAGYQINPSMLKVYDEIDADIYTVPGNSQFSGELAFYCNQRNKRYVFLAGSDFDFNPENKTEPDKVDIYGVPYKLKTYAIENATTHILQNDKQSLMLKNGYGLNGIVIRNPIDLNPQYPRPESAGRHFMGWEIR